jgi:hypothetical protein
MQEMVGATGDSAAERRARLDHDQAKGLLDPHKQAMAAATPVNPPPTTHTVSGVFCISPYPLPTSLTS